MGRQGWTLTRLSEESSVGWCGGAARRGARPGVLRGSPLYSWGAVSGNVFPGGLYQVLNSWGAVSGNVLLGGYIKYCTPEGLCQVMFSWGAM